jgi:hypothetical protein
MASATAGAPSTRSRRRTGGSSRAAASSHHIEPGSVMRPLARQRECRS